MKKDRQQMIIEVSPKFHSDIKTVAAENKKTIKQIVIEALVQYMNKERSETV